jgi:hypothetical protein
MPLTAIINRDSSGVDWILPWKSLVIHSYNETFVFDEFKTWRVHAVQYVAHQSTYPRPYRLAGLPGYPWVDSYIYRSKVNLWETEDKNHMASVQIPDADKC